MSNRNANKQGVIKRDVNAAERAAQAVKLRAQKLTFDEIAKKCGYASPGACRNAIMRELNRTMVKNVQELRTEESKMLDLLQGEVWEMAMDKSNAYRTFAIDRLLAISKRRSELLGLDTPTSEAASANVVVVREVPTGWIAMPTVEAAQP